MGKDISNQILRALHNGNVPPYEGAKRIMCGHEEEREKLLEDLNYISYNNSKVGHSGFKMIYGPYGCGKSFLCEVIKDEALNDGFIVSEIVISKNTQLQSLETIYNKIMVGLRSNEFREFSAFRIIIENWVEILKSRIISKYDLDPEENDDDYNTFVEKIKEEIPFELQKANSTNTSIINSIISFTMALIEGNHSIAQKSLAWFSGDQNIGADIKKTLGVKGNVDKTNVFDFINTLLFMIKESKFAGLLIIIDEVETVRKERRDVRYQAYENLRLLIDMVSKDNLPGCYLLLTGTDELVEDEEKGIKEHDALYTRLEQIKLGDIRVLEQPLIRLKRFDTNQLVDVAVKVRGIHSEVHEWDAALKINNDFIHKYVESFTNAFGREVTILPRTFLKNFIFILEAAKNYPINKILDLLHFDNSKQNESDEVKKINDVQDAMEIDL